MSDEREIPCGRGPILSAAQVANNRLRALLAVNERLIDPPAQVVEAMGHALELLRAELDAEVALADGVAVRVRVLAFVQPDGSYWCVGADSKAADSVLAEGSKVTALLSAVVRKPGQVIPARVEAP